ncbi:hypothetical protein NP233_g6844 [Leucocoprinus birnbaumii]|uniref:Uncharacterized protein n=1 Tax=Leucocoprinus birnbaumii TaxID=56174 RepID=A0AAD5VT30_9AGAR|nr:hypothetical protein NP233_g6844 [Leucocoprinus birnbaumii]
MTLFANAIFRNPHTTAPGTPPAPPTRIPGLGYILFSKAGVPYDQQDNPLSQNTHEVEPPLEAEDDRKCHSTENGQDEPLDVHAQRRRELEAEEARKGEEDWVRSGGVLRDAEGRRDWARTQAVREELKLRELEAQIMERWNTYEQRWAKVLARVKADTDDSNPDTLLRFGDIPWPLKVSAREVSVDDITTQGIEDFLLESLTVRGNKLTKKERVRSSLLRWHPDKLGNILQRIDAEDVEAVRDGLKVVMECLQRLNAQLS